MVFPDCRGSVWRIRHECDSDRFGTGFVVHVSPGVQGATVFLVTCAHVVEDCEHKMTVDGQPAQLVGTGTRNALDLAVVKVVLDPSRCHALPIVYAGIFKNMLMAGEPLCAVGFRKSDERYRRVPLDAIFGQYEDLEVEDQDELRLIQFRLPTDPAQQPKELTQGYSGSPLLGAHGVCGVVDLRERTAGTGTYKVGTAFPLWHLAKIWPAMPAEVGQQLFGKAYWPILADLSSHAHTWGVTDLSRAFQALNLDKLPADRSLWGCALTLSQYDNEDRPIHWLSQFVHALADVTAQPELIDCLPSAEPGAAEETPDIESARVYRRLILRIIERRISSRGERQGGRRYEMQVHTATCQARDGGCCGKNCVDCAPAAAGRLQTIRARTLDETSDAGLQDLLTDQISEILGVFGCEQPDLVQILAPEQLLPNLIFDTRLDRIPALGPTRLCVLHPTTFSGQGRSDPNSSGRYLSKRTGTRNKRWSGSAVRIQSAADDQDLFRQLGPDDNAIVVTGDREVARQCLYSRIPIIVAAAEAPDRIEETIRATECLHRLPRALHEARHSLSLVFDAPNIPIDFAEGEEPVVVGK